MSLNPGGAHVKVTGLSRRFATAGGNGVVAAEDISLEFKPGTVTALTGASGSGKSTVLHLIGAIERPDSGRIEVDGAEVTAMARRELTAYRRRVGFVFQRFHLLPAATALDNVLAPLIPYRVDFDRVARAMLILEQVGLAGRERAFPSQLSGGQQQRVAIARALINDPVLLLADEPTGSLDSATGGAILELLLGLREENGITMIIATHETSLASQADSRVQLRDGRVIETQ